MKNKNQNPLRKIVGKKFRGFGVEGEVDGKIVELGVWDELLECGHSQRIREDMYGAQTLAAKRRCEQCGKEVSDAKS